MLGNTMQVETPAKQKKLEELLERIEGSNRQLEDVINLLQSLNSNLEGEPPISDQANKVNECPPACAGVLHQLNTSTSRYNTLLEELRDVTAPLTRLA